ncbi:MAG: CPBP family intramembrane glutamic endopeptidase [Acidimicrobiales bacterium]
MSQTIYHQTAPTNPIGIRQLSRGAVLAVWAAAALPMGAAAWIVAPAIEGSLGEMGLFKALVLSLTGGLIWQALLVFALVSAEQGTLRWSQLRDALWLRSPRSPKTGRRGGRLWWVVLPLIALYSVGEFIPTLSHPEDRDFGIILESDAGQAFFSGNWGWFGLVVVMFLFNTVLGEELLFRGYLLPRMQEAFGERAWLMNGFLFGTYHLHVPWIIPAAVLVDTFAISYPTQRYRSAWIGIIVHSVQSVFLVIALLVLVLE